MLTTGERIKNARLNAGLTQKKLAELCGLSTGTIQQYELNKRLPKSKEIVEKLSTHLHVSGIYLLWGLDAEDQDVNIIEPDLCELKKEYQDLCYSLTAEELQIMIKIAYAFIKSHDRKGTE